MLSVACGDLWGQAVWTPEPSLPRVSRCSQTDLIDVAEITGTGGRLPAAGDGFVVQPVVTLPQHVCETSKLAVS